MADERTNEEKRLKPKLVVPSFAQDLPDVVALKTVKTEWKDDTVRSYTSLRLRYLTDQEMIEEGSRLAIGLSKGMSERAAASALILAWNLKRPDESYQQIFCKPRPKNVTREEDEKNDHPYDNVDDVLLSEMRGHNDRPPVVDLEGATEQEAARAFAYLAASTLKLFTKRPDSWWKALKHIQDNYSKFMSNEYPFSMMDIQQDYVTKLHGYYQTRNYLKGALGRILSATEGTTINTRMMKLLYCQHLSCTGMHAIPLFIRARSEMGCSSADLVGALTTKSTLNAMSQMALIIRQYLSVDKPDGAILWQYARLFDDSVFAHLQTKNCKILVCILAHLNNLCGVAGAGNILEIAVLEQMPMDRKNELKKVATNIYNNFVSKVDADSNDFFVTDD